MDVSAVAIEGRLDHRARGVALTIRVATYNVHACVGIDGRHDPERVAAVIAELNADIVALQEFTYPLDIALETRTPVFMAALDQYQCALGPARQTSSHCFGNVLLSRHPINDVHRINLSMKTREPRGALAATLDIGGTELRVLATHLGLRVPERRHQVAQIVSYLDSVKNSFLVVLGDFNDWIPGRTAANVLDARLGRVPRPRSFPVSRPMVSLDRIWVQPREALHSIRAHRSALARIASDHFPVVAEVEVPRQL